MVFGRKRYLKQSAHPEDGEEIHCLLGEGCCRVRGRGQPGQSPWWLGDSTSGVPPWRWGHEPIVRKGESKGGCGGSPKHSGHPSKGKKNAI